MGCVSECDCVHNQRALWVLAARSSCRRQLFLCVAVFQPGATLASTSRAVSDGSRDHEGSFLGLVGQVPRTWGVQTPHQEPQCVRGSRARTGRELRAVNLWSSPGSGLGGWALPEKLPVTASPVPRAAVGSASPPGCRECLGDTPSLGSKASLHTRNHHGQEWAHEGASPPSLCLHLTPQGPIL